jgi:hypothetical protein
MGLQSAAGAGFFDGEAFGDFDGDGKWDVTVRRAGSDVPNMFWYVLNSSDGSMTAQH